MIRARLQQFIRRQFIRRPVLGVAADRQPFLPRLTLATVLMLTAPLSSTAQAGDPELGRAKASTCVSCHGVRGISPNPQWPNLAGQKEQYLIVSLKAYRDGQRQDAIMAPLSSNLSDEDIENLAAWYASLPCDGS